VTTKRFSDPVSVTDARILVVEDENIIAKDIELTLKGLGYVVVATVDNGDDAVRATAREQPDLILMDVRLRGPMDGIQAAERIREATDIPVVFLTAFADPATLERARRAAPYGYVLKPFEDRELQAAILMALAKFHAFQELDDRVRERTEAWLASESRSRQLSAVADLGLFALGGHGLAEVFAAATRTVCETLEADGAAVFELLELETRFIVRAPTGSAGTTARATLPTDPGIHPGYALRELGPVASEDYAAEQRFRPVGSLGHGDTDGTPAAGMMVRIHSADAEEPYGVLAVYTDKPRAFEPGEKSFLQAVATVLGTTMARLRADEQRLAAERLAEQERLHAAQAEEALRLRDEFLSIASHELRTPLTALHLQIQSLARRAHTLDETSVTRLARATRSVDRLAKLVTDLLDVSRLSSGRFELSPAQVDLNRILLEATDPLIDEAVRAGCALEVTPNNEPLEGCWDPVRIEQVIANLVTNALKYGAGRPVAVSTASNGAGVEIRVRDHGPGIDPADAERIFDRFERAASSRHYGGLGLGLYISRQIAQAHGGSISVESRPGDGCTFVVHLPRSVPGSPSESPGPAGMAH
jgi:signal transduction histidine kinase/CheY-like chemotaxis protein